VRVSLKASREKERAKILQMAADNRKIAQRIESRQATVNTNRAPAAAASGSRDTGRGQGRSPARRTTAERALPPERPAWQDNWYAFTFTAASTGRVILYTLLV